MVRGRPELAAGAGEATWLPQVLDRSEGRKVHGCSAPPPDAADHMPAPPLTPSHSARPALTKRIQQRRGRGGEVDWRPYMQSAVDVVVDNKATPLCFKQAAVVKWNDQGWCGKRAVPVGCLFRRATGPSEPSSAAFPRDAGLGGARWSGSWMLEGKEGGCVGGVDNGGRSERRSERGWQSGSEEE
jgi:hypothetical protein